jgi:hypothetical protein
LALVVIKSGFIVEDQERRRQLERWAIDRLNRDPALGASQLLHYLGAILDAGATQLNAISKLSGDVTRGGAVAQAIDLLLATRPAMPTNALHSALRAAARYLDNARLQALAEGALANTAVVDGKRIIWNFVKFLADPIGTGERLVAENSGSHIASFR